MKIKSIKTHILKTNIKPQGYSQEINDCRDSAILEIESTDGVVGWGECFFNPATIHNIVDNLCKPCLIGRDPFQWKSIRRDLFLATVRDGPHYGVISGIEVALLDMIGKELNRPIHELFGGAQRNSVKVYATGCYRLQDWKSQTQIIDGMIKEISTYIDKGFSVVKIKIGFSPKEDAHIVRNIRAQMGYDFALAVDANTAWDVPNALDFASRVIDMEIAFFEEPLPISNIEGFLELKNKTNIPLATGEGMRPLHIFRDYLQRNAVDIIQPDIIIAGGFSALQQIQILSTANNIRFIPHCWGSGISFAATAHFMSTLDDGLPWLTAINEPLMEFDQSENPLRDEILCEALVCRKGYLEVPRGPGLGIEIDRSKLEKFSS